MHQHEVDKVIGSYAMWIGDADLPMISVTFLLAETKCLKKQLKEGSSFECAQTAMAGKA